VSPIQPLGVPAALRFPSDLLTNCHYFLKLLVAVDFIQEIPMPELRDYLAATMTVPVEKDGCIPQSMALWLMDTQPPDWDAHRLQAYKWWAEAEARFRYLRADAMLRVRDEVPI
jgi:hypothetical protein